jgi:hypothetical protein
MNFDDGLLALAEMISIALTILYFFQIISFF